MSSIKIIFLILVTTASILEAAGDIVLKKWGLTDKINFLLVGVIIHIVAVFFWAFSLRYELISKAIMITVMINALIVVLVGFFYFKDSLTLWNKVGISLGFLSLILLEF